jgi:hypothetical protein
MIDSYYRTTIYKDTTNVVGLNISQNNSYKTDFETNYKNLTVIITEADFLDTSLNILLNFNQFKLIVTSWSNVRCLEREDRYEIFTLQESELSVVDVQATIVGGNVNINSIVNDSNKFFSDIYDITSKNITTIRTYTVPTGKTFRLVAWQVNADHPLAIDIMLKVNNVTKIKFYLDPSQGLSTNYIYTAPVLFASAGDIVTVVIEPTAPRGELNSVLIGIES